MSDDRLPFERPLGARPVGDGLVEFRVWAPTPGEVRLRLRGEEHPLEDAGLGVREARLPGGHGDDYAFLVDGTALPDPCTRWQPEGLRGPSRIVDPARLAPREAGWRGVALEDLVLYELHVGTFTPEGTFDAAIPYLQGLRELGVTAIEVMPIAEFPGTRGWGYDGVYTWAAQSSYGGPESFARLVAAAHRAGLGVVLDVVYNHVGASGGGALAAFGPYFTDRYSTFWGPAMNFDDAFCDGVREWVLQGAEGWVRDVGVDGFRLDAIHAIFDMSAHPLLVAFGERMRAQAPATLVISESGLNDPRVTRPAKQGGLGHDAAWADDFHHALRTLVTDEREGYYAEFGTVADLAKAFRRPFVHDGEYSDFRRRRFGAPAHDRPPAQFVVFDQNHDQVGNRALGDRLPAQARPLAAFLTLLSPFTPMLFQGEEHGEPAPFLFFTDHIDEDIAVATREGRRREFAAFAAFAGEEVPDPQAAETFQRSKLTREVDAALRDLYVRLLRVRRELPRGDVDDVAFDEAGRWLRVRRGGFELVANLAREAASVPAAGGEVVLATHEARFEGGAVRLPALAGALMRLN
ncbi:MAG: malto-oligosyltrehalose trehalohydrolase [Actinomycetota bacterium]|nr:malto-oligosyltrehalose trehalohydrolase [Actinomycetota bacterium]